MIKYKQLHSLLHVDGKNYIVHVSEWAKMRLSEPELSQFRQDFATATANINQAVADGNIVLLPNLTETLRTGIGDVEVIVGEQYLIKEDFPREDKYTFWQNKMSQDPAVTYYPEEIIP